MKKEILEILKESGTTPAVVRGFNNFMGIYIWENDVFCLIDGMDEEFDSLKEAEQKFILFELKEGNYTLDETFQ